MRIDLRLTSPFFSLLAAVSIAGATPAQKKDELKMPPKADAPQPLPRDQRVMDAAKMYEKYFLNQMFKAMRSTVSYSDKSKPSMGEGIYREQLDDQYVDAWGEKGGIGLANMIHDELLGKQQMAVMRQRAMREARKKGRSPLALTDRDVLSVRKLPNTAGAAGSGETVLVSLGKTTSSRADGPESVRAPWSAMVEDVRVNLGKAQISFIIAATSALPTRKIEMVFDGAPKEVAAGLQVQEGQVVGQLAPGARGILLRQTMDKTIDQAMDQAGSVTAKRALGRAQE